ncbi:MAG: hypothetical protein UY31_C0067G0004 [Candidatus Wolfebacteria bacterium GW2011_GWE1_48_7]|uniref:Uncharacterized protein n=2 Tax=Candidatus Wolfeibacteriota TaxID=1752735 RepID=A0A0G1X4H9_9BACT|nr:MAG: hypothetical protein UX58_C0004G0017 [Candidatus Wolfebacteria bacterium GW2011_GWB2_46_69]KKU54506.1 MAG: hypothetical protein UX76_C0002G0099 [Candidatus Wolfebacteria bacterium GW2011_GWC1_47_103]KKU59833.1 MAG: hypothetical protein UX83_C0002G0120 [Candidatus Wolfebacteria bacterium GW2011_GWE2_47_12]KKU65826.1 MAG: hypothetical protein UX90_C0002G0202 [Candidatus Wolfebacteria bacterium GW2011_GWD2_47_17]KKU73242.1 MAG: hypothetical protein UX96_C0007G0039 [Candidatus Wolfebacteria
MQYIFTMNKTKLFTIIGSVVLTVLIGVISVLADWSNPLGLPPASNTPAPLNVGAASQTKTGALTIGSDLTVNGRVCLGGVCLSAWPDAAAPIPTGDLVNGVCGPAASRLFATAPNDELCVSGIASAVSTSGTTWSWLCNGSGGGISSPCNATRETNWVAVATANKPSQSTDEIWATEKSVSWTSNGPIAGVRVSGGSDDGGYCYASWGSGNIATWRHDTSVGVYNVNNRYYDGSSIYSNPIYVPSTGGYTCPRGELQLILATNPDDSDHYLCFEGYNTCPTNPALFTNDGTAKICQNPWGAGGFATKTTPSILNVLAETVFTLKSNFVDGPSAGAVNCTMEVLYK